MDKQEIFFNFLKDNGLIPAQVIRFFCSVQKFKPDIHFIAGLLCDRDDFDTSACDISGNYEDLLTVLKNKPFESDTLLSNWLKSASKILEMLKNKEIFPNIQIPKEQIEWAMITFIKTCPFIDDKNKENYIHQIEQRDISNGSNIQKLKSSDFKNFLKSRTMNNYSKKTYSSATISAYVSALNYIRDKYSINLWDVHDVAMAQSIRRRLLDNPVFKKENRKDKHNALSAAMALYCDFLEASQT